MADIKVIYINADSLKQEHSEANDSIKLLSLKTANNELTDAKLGDLVGGGDASTQHHHDGRYYRENEHINASVGVADAAKPIITDAAGLIDNSLIDTAGIAALIEHGDLVGLLDDDHTQYIRVDGTRAFSGAQSLGGFKITNLANPTVGTDAVNLQTLQSYQEGLKPKEAVRAATTVAGTLATSFEATDVIDGVTLVAGDRILIKNQAAPAENGIYVVQATGAPVRAIDFDSLSPIDEINGAYTFVQEGTVNAGKGYVQTGTVATLGTDAINFIFFNAADTITASTGLEKVVNDIRIAASAAGAGLAFTAGVLSVNVDDASLEINVDTLRVKADGINDTHIDFGVGANQVSAVDLPIADAGGFFDTDNVEAALQDLADAIVNFGTEYTVGTGGVVKGNLVYVSGNDTVLPLSTLSANEYCVGLALSTEAAAGIVKVLSNDTVLTGVLTGATAGTKYFWNGTALVATAPTGVGSNVWQVGVAKNATDLHVEVRQVKKNG